MLEKLPRDASDMLHNRYTIIRKIAQNGARRTLLAQELQNELVVIKILLFNEEFRWEDLKLFEREAETLKNLDYPAIPKYLDYFELDTEELKGFALVQTYIEAKSLQEYVEAGRNFSEHEIIQLGKLLLEILDYLHSRQPAVIHRDIKPSNILLKNSSGNSVGDIYLVDFGSVQTTIKSHGTRTVVGTYGYMPPEQFGGRAFPASDLYSLGMTLIYLATLKHPSELLDDDLNIQFDQISHLSIELKTWLSLMIQPSLNRRFNSAKTALEAINNLSDIKLKNEYNLFNQKNYSQLCKPSYSKIKLIRTNEKLEIRFPAKTRWQIISNICYAFFPTLVISFVGFFFLQTFINLIIDIFLNALISGDIITLSIITLLSVSLTTYIMINLIIHLFGQTILTLDEKQIVIAKEVNGSRTLTGSQPKIIAREHIWKIVASAEQYKLINLRNMVEKMQKSPSIIFWEATFGQHDLNTYLHQPLKLEERDWLAQQISNFLDVPLFKE
ncbi:serine/threonine kinase [Calothrix sp. NIES-4071]|nr:serine/threonine kinase [Calothrix sp. NIES-4071]BAZ62112.1 serine/threonine kinase [Calothrix sp. NIES-4105]